MPFYRVEYFTEAEAVKHAVIEAPSEILVPFKLREKGYKDLKKVKVCTLIPPEEMNKVLYSVELGIPLVITPIVEAQKSEKPLDPKKELKAQSLYAPSKGKIFIKDGTVGERYVVGDKVYQILRISDFSIRVKVNNQPKPDYIAPNSEVVLFDPEKHAKLLAKKEEPEE